MIDRKNFVAVLRDYTKQVRSFSFAALSAHGLYGLDPRPDAPSTWPELKTAYAAALAGDRMLPVYNGGSDATVFPYPQDNWLFRALHDLDHLDLDADLSADGERLAAFRHIRRFPPGLLSDVATAETYGQLIAFERTGRFVADQREFAYQWLNAGPEAAIAWAEAQP